MIHESLKTSGGASENTPMPAKSDKALVLFVAIAAFLGVHQAMSHLELFGMGMPSGREVVACDGTLMEISGAKAELLDLHNEERAARGVPPLCWRAELANAAQSHSEDMMNRNFYSHDSPEGVSPAERVRSHGYPSAFVAENIHLRRVSGLSEANVRDLENVVEDWMNSPGHRRNLLDARMNEIGIGVAVGRHGGDIKAAGAYTVNFGTLQ
jgi:hypothetical protein